MWEPTYGLKHHGPPLYCYIAAETRSKEKLQGNRYTTSGVIGERRRKRGDGVKEEESSGKKAYIQILGAPRNSQITHQAAATVDVDRNSSKYKETKKVMQRSNHFNQKRWGIKLEKFNDNKGKQKEGKYIPK
jgi:hypothetical protein